MNDWREYILSKFSSGVSKSTLVSDPDCLITEEIVYQKLSQQGFSIVEFENPIEFRYLYESKYRNNWDKGDASEIIIRIGTVGVSHSIPYDIISRSRQLELSLTDLFPNLSYNVISELEPRFYDDLFEAYIEHSSERLSENSTKDFILRHVFGIAPELIKKVPDLLKVLLNRHYRKIVISENIDVRFIQLLRKNKVFGSWPLESIVGDRHSFFSFLQDCWPDYLRSISGTQSRKSMGETIPFGHDDIRVYIDNLFIEGYLEPVSNDYGKNLSQTWVKVGLIDGDHKQEPGRVSELASRVKESIPCKTSRYQDWIEYSLKYAHLLSQHFEYCNNDSCLKTQIDEIRTRSNAQFLNWTMDRYSGLHNLPSISPVMVHHISRFMARQVRSDNSLKHALIVIDGLSLDQWFTIRRILKKQDSNITFEENAVFAWIPTLTSVSRQAIFAGKAPMYFSDSISTTNKESELWQSFWKNNGISSRYVIYQKGIDGNNFNEISSRIDFGNTKIAGFVLTKIDKIMHGMQLGTAGMHNMIRQWAEGGFLLKLFNELLSNGFSIVLTSDHGNIEASGCGRPMEGATADVRGERARIYSDEVLREEVQSRFENCISWSNSGLPEDYLPIVLGDTSAFIGEKQTTVAHGGVSIEEVIVPFITIERN